MARAVGNGGREGVNRSAGAWSRCRRQGLCCGGRSSSNRRRDRCVRRVGGIGVFVDVGVIGVFVMSAVKVLVGVASCGRGSIGWRPLRSGQRKVEPFGLSRCSMPPHGWYWGVTLMGMLNKRVREDCEVIVSGLKEGIKFPMAMIGEYLPEPAR